MLKIAPIAALLVFECVIPESSLVVLPYVSVKGSMQPWDAKMSIYTSMEANLDSFLGHPIVMKQK